MYNPPNDLPARYMPRNDEELSKFDPKILDGGGQNQWRNLPQSEPIDVKQEIQKLNTSKHKVHSTFFVFN